MNNGADVTMTPKEDTPLPGQRVEAVFRNSSDSKVKVRHLALSLILRPVCKPYQPG